MPAERQHPERQRVDPRERHVRRADLERHDVVPEARQHRDDEQEDHHRPVHREELVVERSSWTSWRPGAASSVRTAEGEEPADEEEDERVDDVEDPDLLVVGRRHPLVQAAPVGGGGGRQRGGRHRCSLLDRERAEHHASGGSSTRTCRCPRGAAAPGSPAVADAGEVLVVDDLLAAGVEDVDVVRRARVLVVEVDRERLVGRRAQRRFRRT